MPDLSQIMKNAGTLYCLWLLMGITALQAQPPEGADTVDITFVRWVAQFPPTVNKGARKSFFGKVGEFVFGKKPVVLVNPVAIIGNNPQEYWVLDKKMQMISRIAAQKAEALKYKDKHAHLSSPVNFCAWPGKGFLITDSQEGKIYFLPEGSKKISVFGDTLTLNQPTGIAYARNTGEVWVLETREHRLLVLNEHGRLLKTIGGRGTGPGQFNFPTHLWIDNQGRVYVVDSMNFRVQIFDGQGNWLSMFGKAGDATGYFARPKGIATDSHGNIYVADALFHAVQIFNNKGEFLYNFGQQGRGKGDFWLPNGIYIDTNDYIYVADSYNSRVQVFQLINHE